MASSALVSRVRFVPAAASANREGLLGWVSFATSDGLLIDGVALRLSRSGRPLFVWPARRDRNGKEHHLIRPTSDAVRAAIEHELLTEIRALASGSANALAVPAEPERHQVRERAGEPRENQR